jgi:hypothetical protein
LYAPTVDVNEWKLTVGGEVQNPITLTLDELKRAPKHAVTVTLECAGNGRAFFDPPVAGIQWEKGAVGQVDPPHPALLEQRQDAIAILQHGASSEFPSLCVPARGRKSATPP